MKCVNKMKTKDMIEAEVLSKHRTSLMGVAIICIVFCHTSLCVPDLFDTAYNVCRQFLQIGVDIFFLLSGIGCFYSLHRNDNIFKFYWRRFCKIFVPYILIILMWGMIQPCIKIYTSVFGFLYTYSLVTFFIRGVLNSWYVAAILVLYALAPFIYKAVNKKRGIAVSIFCYIFAIGMEIFAYLYSETTMGYAIKIVSEIFLNRIAVFVIGMQLGYFCLNGGIRISRKVIKFCSLTFLFLFFLNVLAFPGNKWFLSQWFITRCLFMPMCLGMTLLLGNFFEYNMKMKEKTFLRRAGMITFEVYLLHEKILVVFDKWLAQSKMLGTWESVLSNFIAIVITLLLAEILHFVIVGIQDKMQKLQLRAKEE